MNRITELIKNKIHPITGWQYNKSKEKPIIKKPK